MHQMTVNGRLSCSVLATRLQCGLWQGVLPHLQGRYPTSPAKSSFLTADRYWPATMNRRGRTQSARCHNADGEGWIPVLPAPPRSPRTFSPPIRNYSGRSDVQRRAIRRQERPRPPRFSIRYIQAEAGSRSAHIGDGVSSRPICGGHIPFNKA